jgi:hypothetical protein
MNVMLVLVVLVVGLFFVLVQVVVFGFLVGVVAFLLVLMKIMM